MRVPVGAGAGTVAEGVGTVVGATTSACDAGAEGVVGTGAEVVVTDALEPEAAEVVPASFPGLTAAPSTASASTPAGMA
ncbi:hypothetical protein ACI78R_10440 [Geodermatophilus sp. SYSU D01106]